MNQPNDSAALVQKADRALLTTESTENTEESVLNLFLIHLCALCALCVLCVLCDESFTAGMSR